jgi:hypothetical protein
MKEFSRIRFFAASLFFFFAGLKGRGNPLPEAFLSSTRPGLLFVRFAPRDDKREAKAASAPPSPPARSPRSRSEEAPAPRIVTHARSVSQS